MIEAPKIIPFVCFFLGVYIYVLYTSGRFGLDIVFVVGVIILMIIQYAVYEFKNYKRGKEWKKIKEIIPWINSM